MWTVDEDACLKEAVRQIGLDLLVITLFVTYHFVDVIMGRSKKMEANSRVCAG